jgi:non-specific serine/threonine protein kinase
VVSNAIYQRIFWELCFFCGALQSSIEKNKTKQSAGTKNLVSPFILRRTKEQVLKDLPELSEQVFYCDMEPEQEKLYEEEKSKARNALLKPMVLALTK